MGKRKPEYLKENKRIHENSIAYFKEQSKKRREKMIKAKFIKITSLQHGGIKDRWECPKCREDPDQPECRFNLNKKKRGSYHPCRFCSTKLSLEK